VHRLQTQFNEERKVSFACRAEADQYRSPSVCTSLD
jgi:hypothetical protein